MDKPGLCWGADRGRGCWALLSPHSLLNTLQPPLPCQKETLLPPHGLLDPLQPPLPCQKEVMLLTVPTGLINHSLRAPHPRINLIGLGFILFAQLQGCGDSGPRGTSVAMLRAMETLSPYASFLLFPGQK